MSRRLGPLALAIGAWLVGYATAVTYSIEDSNTQFIFYGGTLSGAMTLKRGNTSDCGDNGVYYFGPIPQSQLRIGVNGPWDTNRMFFELEHYGTDYQKNDAPSTPRAPNGPRMEAAPRGGVSPRAPLCFGTGGCTYDALFNLYFATSWLACEKDGKACGSFVFSPYYYVPAQTVDLDFARVSRISDESISKSDHGTFYSLNGDQSTWVPNGTETRNTFDWQPPRNYTFTSYQCPDELAFAWNGSTPFSYHVNFTNTTGMATFTLSTDFASIEMNFEGTRDDKGRLEPEDFDGNPNAISLANPDDNSYPHFTYLDGADFTWDTYSDGTWYAKPSTGSPAHQRASIALVWGIMAVAFYALL